MTSHISQPAGSTWDQVKNIFDRVVVAPPGKRSELIRQLCQDAPHVETEVNRLVAADQYASTFLETPPTILLNDSNGNRGFNSLAPGEVLLDRFRIVRFLASGGMGEVYEAWDSELQDRVALKTIRPEIAASGAIIERFKQEVKQARAISHPNVCRVYDLFSHDRDSAQRCWFLTMELLEGETLLDRVCQRGPFDTQEALVLTNQLVDGLAAAHRLGVVHRDFKSGNIMIVKEQEGKRHRAVITDFGLALKTSGLGETATLVEGTFEYMAPEQRRGSAVGFAADQYALGIVMCEMLSGVRPVRKVLLPAIDEHLVLPSLPPRWARVIQRCLETEPSDRFPQISDIAFSLDRSRRRRTVKWLSTVVALATIAIAIIYYLVKPRLDANRLTALEQLTPSTDLSGSPSISRDGSAVAYMSDRGEVGNLDIWLQHLPRGRPIRLTTDPSEDVDPSISPDGRHVVFRSYRNGGGIYIVDSVTGTETLLARNGLDPRYSPDGTKIVYWIGDVDMTHASGRMYILNLRDGRFMQLASQFADARLPIWNSDGRHILFTGCANADQLPPACNDWWIISSDGRELYKTGAFDVLRAQHITPVNAIGTWLNNTVIFSGTRDHITSLWEIKVGGGISSPEVGRAQQISSSDPRVNVPSSSLAENGTVVFSQMAAAVHIWRLDHALSSHKEVLAKVTYDPGIDSSPNISSNGRWLAFSRGSGGTRNIWVQEISSGSEAQFSRSRSAEVSPLIDDSGNHVIFEVIRDNRTAILMKTRGQEPVEMCTGCSAPSGWFNGNTWFFYRDELDSTIKMMNIRTRESKTVVKRQGWVLSEASCSGGGYLLFSAATGAGKKQIFVVRLTSTGESADDRWIPISNQTAWADKGRWSADGNAIFYLAKYDNFLCVWGQRFDFRRKRTIGEPFPVLHFHNPRFTPETVSARSFSISVCGDTIYLNPGEVTESIWTGKIKVSSFWRF